MITSILELDSVVLNLPPMGTEKGQKYRYSKITIIWIDTLILPLLIPFHNALL